MSRTSYNPFYTNSWAIVVGINEYESAGTLSYATHDAEAVYELLENQLDFKKDNIHLLLNDDATRLNILGALTKIQEESVDDDRLVFFFAGHGYTLEGARGPVGFLIPTEGETSNLGSLIAFDDLVRISITLAPYSQPSTFPDALIISLACAPTLNSKSIAAIAGSKPGYLCL